MTPEERILWDALRRNSLGVHFRRSQPIAGYIVDFYCHSKGLVVEVDGCPHQRQQGYDKFRDASLEKLGLRVLRLSNHQIRNELPGVIAAIRATLT
jgi:very-short-patch-repair endonuclease